MNHSPKTAAILCLSLLVSSCLSFEYPDGDDSEPELSVTAEEVSRDWVDNPISAREKYDGKIIAVSGIIARIHKRSGTPARRRVPAVLLEAARPASGYYDDDILIFPLVCYFDDDKEGEAALAKLKRGQQVTIKGEAAMISDLWGNYEEDWIELWGCVILDAGPPGKAKATTLIPAAYTPAP